MFMRMLRRDNATGDCPDDGRRSARKLDELDRLLNDPDVPMEPEKVWTLLAEIAQRDGVAARGGAAALSG